MSVPGFRAARGIGSNDSSGRRMDRGLGRGSASSVARFAATNLPDVDARTSRVPDATTRTLDDLPWAAHQVTRSIRSAASAVGRGIRTEQVAFADGHAHHPSAAPGHWPGLPIDVHVTRPSSARLQLDQSPSSGEGVPHGLGADAAETAAAASVYRGKKHQFATVLSDLKHGEVIGLAKNRSEASLAGLLRTCLDPRQRAAVQKRSARTSTVSERGVAAGRDRVRQGMCRRGRRLPWFTVHVSDPPFRQSRRRTSHRRCASIRDLSSHSSRNTSRFFNIHRGLREVTLYAHRRWGERFLHHLAQRVQNGDLGQLTVPIVDAFVLLYCRWYGPSGAARSGR